MINGYRTIIAAAVALVAALAGELGFEFDWEGLTNSVVTIAALFATIWFRWTATRDIRRGGALRKD